MTTTDTISAALAHALRGIVPPGPDLETIASMVEEADASISRLRQLIQQAAGGNSLEAVMAGAVRTTIAIADADGVVQAAIKEMQRTSTALNDAMNAARDALRTALLECGDPGAAKAETETHVAYCTDGRPGVDITEPAKLPSAMWRTRDPEPNKAAILALLKAGQTIPGASLKPGVASLTITPKRETR